MRAAEADHVGHQPVQAVQRAVGFQRDGRIAVPAEGFQHFGDEALRVGLTQPAVAFGLCEQRARVGGEDVALGQDRLGLGTQRGIGDQFKSQQRGEDAERIGGQRLFGQRPERSRMHRHAGHGEVVVADRMHAHHREHAAQHRQFRRRAHADRAMALQVQALGLAVTLQALGQGGVALQRGVVDVADQRDQVAVQRHLGAVHVGHGLGEQAADAVGRNEGGHGARRAGGVGAAGGAHCRRPSPPGPLSVPRAGLFRASRDVSRRPEQRHGDLPDAARAA